LCHRYLFLKASAMVKMYAPPSHIPVPRYPRTPKVS
jgi:hypothetical protein